MPLEDDFCDILKKARTGQGLSVGDVARMTGLPGGDITALERGDQPRDRAEVRALAKALDLRAESLEQIAIDKWEPVAQRTPPWVEMVQGSISGYGVQGYIVHDEGEALLVDTAYNAHAMLDVLRRRSLRLIGICLTHGHADHADGIEQILSHREVPVYLGRRMRPLELATTDGCTGAPIDGLSISVGRRTVYCVTTPAIHLAASVIGWMTHNFRSVLLDTLCRIDRSVQSQGAVFGSYRFGAQSSADALS